MHILLDYNAKCSLSGLNFDYFNKDEVHKLSVKEIKKPYALDKLLNPVQNGLYDLALGPLDKNDICLTCSLDYFKCPGHFGHVDLALPIYNPVFFKELVKLLRASCLSCHTLLTNNLEKDYFFARMKLIRLGLVEHLGTLENLYVDLIGSFNYKTIACQSFRNEFNQLIDSIEQKSGAETSTTMTRMVVNFKMEIVKEFFSKLKGAAQICPNCGLPLRQLRAEHHSKLFFAKGVSTRKLKKNTKVKALANQPNSEPVADEAGLEPELKAATNEDDTTLIDNLASQAYLTPIEVRKHLKELFKKEADIIYYILGKSDADVDKLDQTNLFFFDAVAIPPSRYRPISQFKDQRFENPQTSQLCKLVEQNIILRETLNEIIHHASDGANIDKSEDTEKNGTNGEVAPSVEELNKALSKLDKKSKTSTLHEKLQSTWLQIQQIVNVLYDSDLDKLNREGQQGGLKQILEKKEGLFRKHMMGKRVNYAGRSVISPDVYIGTDEIGIPEMFAKKLTYPQPVNAVNFWEMKQLVLNGPDVYPGASLVEYGNGNVVRLRANDYESRLAIAKQLLTPESSIDSNLDIKIVHRHLKNNDILLFNRQPTLHRPSIMAHRARVLPNEKTLRFHYSNCKAYNADFDGDEMNAHLPQNEIARAEGLNLMLSHLHYLVPKDGTPLSGLIQDHVISGTTLTLKNRFFDREDYQHLVYNSFHKLRSSIKLLPPAIVKPKKLWTGKQVISTLLINLLPEHKGALNLEGKAKIPIKSWNINEPRLPEWSKGSVSYTYLNESYVLFRGGHLLCGVLDKAHYGSSSFSLVHCCYELYGGGLAGDLLSCLGRLFTTFIQMRGFTLGIEDILIKDEHKHDLAKQIKKFRKCGHEALQKVLNPSTNDNKDERERELIKKYKKMHLNPDDSYMREIDLAYKGTVDAKQNKLIKVCFPNGLVKNFLHNNLQIMIQSGAKGSSVNSMQMSCVLGQQELEGRRPRLMVNGNTLPSFRPYDPSPMSGGFIPNSFMSGLTPQEYFFHCMAGREGLVDTAVKTSRSGYLQRCLIKHMEGIVVNYDLTVRDSDSSVIQFQYGEDSLLVEKTPFLDDKQFPFLIQNYPIITSNKHEIDVIRSTCKSKKVTKQIDKIKEWKRNVQPTNGTTTYMRSSPFLHYSQLLCSQKEYSTKPFEQRIKQIVENWQVLSEDERKTYGPSKKCKRRLPISADYHADRYLGVISETLEQSIDNYLRKHQSDFDRYANNLSAEDFRELIYLKSIRSCIEPGDSVGILAAQSIGEPSTQMTLNTFHFAGRGDMNVTLGIPRLREILMVASDNIKTPSMQVPVFAGDEMRAKAEQIQSHFTRTLLWDCLAKIEIEQTLDLNYESSKRRLWLSKVRFELLPETHLKSALNTPVNTQDVFDYIEQRFLKSLCISINKKYNQLSSSTLLHVSSVREKSMKNLRNINVDDDEAVADRVNQLEDKGDDIEEIDADVMDAGESSTQKLIERIDDERDYDGEEEEKKQLNENSSDEENDENEDDDDDGHSKRKPSRMPMEEQEEDDVLATNGLPESKILSKSSIIIKKIKKVNEERVIEVLKISSLIANYNYDCENSQWAEVTFKLDALKPRIDLFAVVQKLAKQSYLAKVEGIKRCFLNQSTMPEDNGCYKITTEGINVKEIVKYTQILDVEKLYLNDIHLTASTFGIEAAVKVIINEIKKVFGAYGINVDYRHLSLIADYMTFEGVYKPFNRIGIRSNASPLQKMSFEMCLQFFKDSYLLGQHEDLNSPSASLVTGRMAKIGTGKFELLTKLV